MTYWLDYSAGKMNGATIKAAGYGGAIRYIDSPAKLGTKHTNPVEANSIRSAGLGLRLVMEVSTGDAEGGFARGAEYAQRAAAGAVFINHPGVIYFCNDKPTVTNPQAWTAYLNGAASVLGWGRVGAYGFFNAIDVARLTTGCQHYWQAGRRSDVRSYVQLWQDNNTQVNVGGITCDRNLILKDLQDTEIDLTPEEHEWLRQVQAVVGAAYDPATGATLGSRVKAIDERPAVDPKALADALVAAGLTVQGGASVDEVRQIVHDALNSARVTTG